MPHTPHTPHTPQSTPHTPAGGASGPPSVPPASQESTGNHNTSGNTSTTINNDTAADIPSDLNFDPAAVIDGEGTGQEALNVSTSHRVRLLRRIFRSKPEYFFLIEAFYKFVQQCVIYYCSSCQTMWTQWNFSRISIHRT